MMVLSLIVSLLGAFPQISEQQDAFRFEVEVRTVYADVFVTRDGSPVTGLTAEDFEVFDNGVRQEIELLDHGDLPLTTMLLLDISGSVLGDKLGHLRVAAHMFVDKLSVNDEVGLLTFSRKMRLRMDLGSDFAALHRVLELPVEQGETSLYDALYAGLKLVEARAGRSLVVLFTDGLDNTSWLNASEVLDVLKESDTVVYVVGVQPRLPFALRNSGRSICRRPDVSASNLLGGITDVTGGRVWYIDPATNITDVFLSILNEMENRYLLSYQPRGVPWEGWHTLEIKLTGHQADKIRARPGYLLRKKQ